MKKQTERKVYEIVLTKLAQRQIADDVLRRQLTEIVDRALSGSRERQGWAHLGLISCSKREGNESAWIYTSKLRFRRGARRISEETERRQFEYMKYSIISVAASSRGWELYGEAPKTYASVPTVVAKKPVADPFANIYGREAQIKLVEAAIETAIQSNFQQRNNCVLYGPTGCGKTSILEGYLKKLGGGDLVMRMDATSLTQAGAEEEILNLAKVPRFLLLEEAEKTHPDNLRWLIPVLDHRGELVKTNARVNVRKEAKLLCIATVNNMNLFKSLLAGAVASRFTQKIYCPPPNRQILEQILKDKLVPLQGKMEWIKPTLDYCEKWAITDPRDVISICTCGKDALISGDYLRWLEETMEPKEPA